MTGFHAALEHLRGRAPEPNPQKEQPMPSVITTLDRRIAAGRADLAPLRDQLAQRMGGGR
jgi:hypothetical protein